LEFDECGDFRTPKWKAPLRVVTPIDSVVKSVEHEWNIRATTSNVAPGIGAMGVWEQTTIGGLS